MRIEEIAMHARQSIGSPRISKSWSFWILSMLLVSVLGHVGCSVQQMEGHLAPELSIQALGGERHILSEYRGDVVLLNFWGTWCGPCRAEQPLLNELQNRYRSSGLTVLGVAVKSTRMAIELWKENLSVPYEILLPTAEDSVDLERYDHSSIPFSVLIDREGYIRKEYRGMPVEEQLHSDVELLLAEEPGMAASL